MKNWERIAGFVTTTLALLSWWGAYQTLPYRMDQAEKAAAMTKAEFSKEIEDVRSVASADRVKAIESKEMLIRIEERLKNLQGTVETLARSQRLSVERPVYGKTTEIP